MPGSERAISRLLWRGRRAEERLAGLIEEHRRELEAQRARFQETIEDLERREQLLSDARASVERLLRLGSKDLDARETDVARLVSELTEREEGLRDEEAEIGRRRTELGAVELRRKRVEQRELALEAREARLEEREAEVREPDVAPTLAFVPGAAYRLVEIDAAGAGGEAVDVDGETYDILRIGPSPLPGDARRCAYLVRGLRNEASPGGSS